MSDTGEALQRFLATQPPVTGPGWRIDRIFRMRDGWWRATAVYNHPLVFDAGGPDYSYYDDGDTPEAAQTAVLARASKDKDWPLMFGAAA